MYVICSVCVKDVPAGDHFEDLGVEELHLAEGGVERELLVVRGDGLRHRLKVDFVDTSA